MSDSQGAAVTGGANFYSGSSGVWAGQRFLEYLEEHGTISPAALRTLETLRKDEWISYDEALVAEGQIRLRAVADLVNAGLVATIPNGLGKTVRQWEKITDMEPAQHSLDGNVMSEDDRQEFSLESLPLPITHKDFSLNIRTLMASRERGESLDVTQARTAGRLVAEATEALLINGSSKVYGGLPIYGYTTHPHRNTGTFGTGGAWSGTKTGEQILADALTMKGGLETDRMYGPYAIYVPAASSTILDEDFKANGDKTTRMRLLEIDGIQSIQVCDQLATGSVVMVQLTSDVAEMVEGEPLQTVQWDIHGGFRIRFKAFTIMVPLVKSDAQARSGVYVMTT
jgi:hypothetical protein